MSSHVLTHTQHPLLKTSQRHCTASRTLHTAKLREQQTLTRSTLGIEALQGGLSVQHPMLRWHGQRTHMNAVPLFSSAQTPQSHRQPIAAGKGI